MFVILKQKEKTMRLRLKYHCFKSIQGFKKNNCITCKYSGSALWPCIDRLAICRHKFSLLKTIKNILTWHKYA